MSGKRSGVTNIYCRTPGTGRIRPLIHYPGICGGPDCEACAAEQELAERNEQ